MAGKSRSLGSLLVNVGADTRALDEGLKSATRNVKQFGNTTSSTARRSEGSLKKISRGGFNISESFAGIGRALPGIGGLFGIGAIGSLAFDSIQKGFSDAAEVSPSVATIRARREQFKFKKALERGEKNPELAEALAGGGWSSVQAGFMNVVDVMDKNQREQDFLGYLGSSLPIGQIVSFFQGFMEEQSAAAGEGGFLPIDRTRLERNRLELFGPSPVAVTGSGSTGGK